LIPIHALVNLKHTVNYGVVMGWEFILIQSATVLLREKSTSILKNTTLSAFKQIRASNLKFGVKKHSHANFQHHLALLGVNKVLSCCKNQENNVNVLKILLVPSDAIATHTI